MDQAARGAAALSASNYDEAVRQYTAAIACNPQAVDYYIKRSTAYQRSSQSAEALADAEVAVALAHRRSKRELILEAQLRHAIALFNSERYADAKFILGIVHRLDPKEKTHAIWEMKAEQKLKGLAADDHRAKVAAKEIPDVEIPEPKKAEAKPDSPSVVKVDSPVLATTHLDTASTTAAPQPAPSIKEDWYQNTDNVIFTLLVKGVPKDETTVDIEKDRLSLAFPYRGSEARHRHTVEPLFAKVDPAQSTYRVTPTKIEVTLRKAHPGRWPKLKGDILDERTTEQPPAYPTSSKKGVKDWDKVATDLTAKKSKDDKGGDDYDLDADEGGDEAGRFFKQLYKDATEEQQRAMMKSYQESGGTVLSTDWSSVGKGTVNPEPPESMEAKKW